MNYRFAYLIFLCVSVGILISCDDFLRETPRDKLPEEEAYEDISSLYLNAVASLYNNIGGYSDSQGLQGTGRGVYDLNTFTTDEAIMPVRGGDWYDGGFSCINGVLIMMRFKPHGNIFIKLLCFVISLWRR